KKESTEPGSNLLGNWDLLSISYVEQGQTIELTPPAVAGSIVFTTDNRYTLTIIISGVTETEKGSWHLSNNDLTMKPDINEPVYSGTVSSDIITFNRLLLINEKVYDITAKFKKLQK
ncbi:hypothetical protein DRQ09_09980, partial [candidate division KSB1 bacterium]